MSLLQQLSIAVSGPFNTPVTYNGQIQRLGNMVTLVISGMDALGPNLGKTVTSNNPNFIPPQFYPTFANSYLTYAQYPAVIDNDVISNEGGWATLQFFGGNQAVLTVGNQVFPNPFVGCEGLTGIATGQTVVFVYAI
jgi:hypothetical protein